MTDLLTRLREGSGPDRELDRDIFWHFFSERCFPDRRRYDDGPIPELTASLDAVFALVERELPEVCIELVGPYWSINIPSPIPAHCYAKLMTRSIPSNEVRVWHDDRRRALLLALITAKEPSP